MQALELAFLVADELKARVKEDGPAEDFYKIRAPLA
jgi:hypothetical protein